ncbi:sperm flagellar protein 2-like [Diabrotica virgifera virgifera]|uniref:Sperm flagellar protein 2-like isoform X1 n=1 Tax=Diabrotica virgifera virgifera TaxID=50390 RepID=A0A6P7GCD6_DIAVI|nr:sperm flagellar protein 2-like [Diabrotica virgifera virgifera]
MAEVVSQWIQEKLGVLVSLNPEVFCDVTRDGYLLSKILRSYEIINEDQLSLIQRAEIKDICLSNFQNYLVHWLKPINIHLEDEDIANITEGKKLASLSIFYRAFLELHEKDCLTFIAKSKLNGELRNSVSKFTVSKVKENPFSKLENVENRYNVQLENSYDVVHWLQDRFEMVINKCKTAREEYLATIRNSERRVSSSFAIPGIAVHHQAPVFDFYVDNASPKSVDLTYDELVEETRKIRTSAFIPDIKQAKEITQKIKDKFKDKADADIFRKDMEEYIRKVFWNRLLNEENQDFETHLSSKMLKQSLYETQMLKKMEEIAKQEEHMLRSKQIIVDEIMKEQEALFVEKLLEKDDSIDKKKFEYYLEKERLNQLHKVLYGEVRRLREEKKQKICRDTVKALCDMTIKYSEFQSYFEEPPQRRVLDQWNKLIVSGLSLEDPAVSAVALIDEKSIAPEQIKLKELERQSKADEKEFESYVNFEWPWLLSQINVEEETLYKLNCGMNVLGQKVHLLLDEKYPLPALPTPPDLPRAHIRVCVNGLSDITCLPLLSKLLQHKNIVVVELQDAVTYCMSAYKHEIAVTKEEETKDDALEEKVTKVKKEKVVKGKKGKAAKRPKKEGLQTSVDHQDKLVQTPRIFPSEEIVLTPFAELGRIAEEELSKGNVLTDYLLVSMFIEYLRSKPDIEGWVLINYPTNIEQAILLEETLSGLKVPGVPESSRICKSLIDIVYICDPEDDVEEDERRFSKLVRDPTQPLEPPAYDTVLTGFINICPDIDQETTAEWTESSKEQMSSFLNEPEEDLNLKQFYADMGCYYSLYYKSFEYSPVKQLAKLIIGDYTIPPKSSIELFGDVIRYIESDKVAYNRPFKSVKSGEKVERERIEKVFKKTEVSLASSEIVTLEKPKKGKKEKKAKKQKGGTIIVREEKYTQIPSVTIVEIEEDDPTAYQIEPKPGEPGYKYLTVPIHDKIGSVITNFWEHMEEVFVNDMTQVLFLKKTHLNMLMPYICYVKTLINKHIIKPDERQMYLMQFQERFNQFDSDFRRDNEFKAELHCLVNELKNRLLDMCDNKMIAAEQERRAIIHKNWSPIQLAEIINNYINGFQLELDRHIDTLMFINDYFTGLISQVITEDEITKEILHKFELENKTFEKLVNDYLLDKEEHEHNENPLKGRLEAIYHTALVAAEVREVTAFDHFMKVKLLCHPDEGKGKGKAKKKKEPKTLLTAFEQSKSVKNNQDRIFDEWLCALHGEIARVEVRFLLLKHDMFENVIWFIKALRKTFNEMHSNIKTRYIKEVECVKKACHFLSTAIENEVPIQEELLFVDDDFLINADSLMFESPVQQDVEELSDDLLFSVSKLQKITDILSDLAPDGFLQCAKFIFILQDFIASEKPYLVPKEWRKLEGYRVKYLSQRLFESQSYITWKDFIIYNLTIPIPTDKELVSLKNQCLLIDTLRSEVISKEEFLRLHFWFDKDDENKDKSNGDSVKKLLFEMYRYDKESCNYTAMLLDFCKGASTQEGVAKALAVVIGKPVCWSEDIGRSFVEEVFRKREIHEEEVRQREIELQEYREFIGSIINSIIDKTVHSCDSVVITEILPRDDEETREVGFDIDNQGEYIPHERRETASRHSRHKNDVKGFRNSAKKMSRASESHEYRQRSKSRNSESHEHRPRSKSGTSESHESRQRSKSGTSESHENRHRIRSVPETETTGKSYIKGESVTTTSSHPHKQKSSSPPTSSNTIGFENQTSPSLCYFLRYDDIAKVLAATLSNILGSKDNKFFDVLCNIYQICKNSAFNNEVLCHEFLNCKDFLQLMEGKTKFVIKYPGRIVKEMLK